MRFIRCSNKALHFNTYGTYVHNLTSIYFRYRYKKWTLLLITKQTEPVHNICSLQHLCAFFLFLSRSWDRYTLAVNSQYQDELQGSTCIGRLPFVLRRQMMTMSTMMRLSRMTAQMTPMMITSVSVRSVFWDCPTKHKHESPCLINKAENVNKTHLTTLSKF